MCYIKCSWCGKDLGEKPPLEDKRTSHSMCLDCEKKMNDELDKKFGKEEDKPSE